MDAILDAIEAALKRKGLTDAAASRMAVGHPSLIKNMRLPREGEKRYNLPALQKLADVLDLEFYFGPRRKRDHGFHESSGNGPPTILAPPTGYATFVWDEGDLRGIPPVAFSHAWINLHGLDYERHTCVHVGDAPEDSAEPAVLALIDRQAPRTGGPALWALRHAGRNVEVARVQFDGTTAIVLPESGTAPARLIRPGTALPLVLGRVLWHGAVT